MTLELINTAVVTLLTVWVVYLVSVVRHLRWWIGIHESRLDTASHHRFATSNNVLALHERIVRLEGGNK